MVRAAIGAEQTPRTTGQVYGCLGCSPQCGRCARTIRRIMDDAVTAARGCCAGTTGVLAQRGDDFPLSRQPVLETF
jgi:bacterioferritin-associated ferredoxin